MSRLPRLDETVVLTAPEAGLKVGSSYKVTRLSERTHGVTGETLHYVDVVDGAGEFTREVAAHKFRVAEEVTEPGARECEGCRTRFEDPKAVADFEVTFVGADRAVRMGLCEICAEEFEDAAEKRAAGGGGEVLGIRPVQVERFAPRAPFPLDRIVTHPALAERAERLHAALSVLALSPRIAAWLSENDPKALEQARAALQQWEG